jgi:hypothetical protein
MIKEHDIFFYPLTGFFFQQILIYVNIKNQSANNGIQLVPTGIPNNLGRRGFQRQHRYCLLESQSYCTD